MEISRRLKETQKKADISTKRLAKYADITYDMCRNYLSGRSAIPNEVLVKFCEILNTDLVWVLTGNGATGPEMATDVLKEPEVLGKFFISSLFNRIDALEKEVSALNKKIEYYKEECCN